MRCILYVYTSYKLIRASTSLLSCLEAFLYIYICPTVPTWSNPFHPFQRQSSKQKSVSNNHKLRLLYLIPNNSAISLKICLSEM